MIYVSISISGPLFWMVNKKVHDIILCLYRLHHTPLCRSCVAITPAIRTCLLTVIVAAISISARAYIPEHTHQIILHNVIFKPYASLFCKLLEGGIRAFVRILHFPRSCGKDDIFATNIFFTKFRYYDFLERQLLCNTTS